MANKIDCKNHEQSLAVQKLEDIENNLNCIQHKLNCPKDEQINIVIPPPDKPCKNKKNKQKKYFLRFCLIGLFLVVYFKKIYIRYLLMSLATIICCLLVLLLIALAVGITILVIRPAQPGNKNKFLYYLRLNLKSYFCSK